nr:hypothetical protein [uncultured Holophaga sp.]
MRSSSLLLVPVLVLAGCKGPKTTVNYSPLENIPPKSLQRFREGGLAFWALASVKGKVSFYLVPPQGTPPLRVSARMGGRTLEAECRNEMGRTYYTWEIELDRSEVTRPVFPEPLTVEAAGMGGALHRLRVAGLGTDSYPILNMCYFDLVWETLS